MGHSSHSRPAGRRTASVILSPRILGVGSAAPERIIVLGSPQQSLGLRLLGCSPLSELYNRVMHRSVMAPPRIVGLSTHRIHWRTANLRMRYKSVASRTPIHATSRGVVPA